MRSRLAVVIFLALAVGGSVAYFAGGHGAKAPATTTTSSATTTTVVAQPIRGVGELTTNVVEPNVLMCPPGHPCAERQYSLQVYYPTTASSTSPQVNAKVSRPLEPYPLIVFAIGFDTMPDQYLPIIEPWVLSGYVVASPVFPLTSTQGLANYGVSLLDTGLADEYEDDLANQPRDMSFALDEVTTLNSDGSSPLFNVVNTTEVAAIGQSDGGDATLALVDNSCCIDNRFRAAVVMSGAEFPGFSGAYFSTGTTPLLITQGTADTVNLPSLSNVIFANAPSPKAFLTLLGATHLEPYTATDAYQGVVSSVTLDFLGLYLKGDSISPSTLAKAGDVAGVSQIALALGSST